jgi:hypothetical protein
VGVRRNLNRLTEPERRRWVAAVKRMKADRAADYNYDKFVHMHDRAQTGVQRVAEIDANPAHGGPAFCPWHRYFITRFEHDLQLADRANGGDGRLTLPYWDWTNDHETTPNRQRGGLWADDFLGGNGNPVNSGPFRAGEWATVPLPRGAQGTDLVRRMGSGGSTLPRDTDVRYALETEGFDCRPYGLDPGNNEQGIRAPSSPVLRGRPGGRLPAGQYRIVITYLNGFGETRPSPETAITVSADDQIIVSSPPPRAGAIGWRVYAGLAGAAAGTETLQGGTNAIGTPHALREVVPGRPRPVVNETASFRALLEGWSVQPSGSEPAVHNQVHVFVGGSMVWGTSPNDPVFFLHHCNIDRLWALWQFRHPGRNYPEEVPELGNPGVMRPHGIDAAMPPWTSAPEIVRPRDVLDHTRVRVLGRDAGCTYDTDPPGVAVDVG